MDIYEEITQAFTRLPSIGEWTEARSLFERVAARHPAHWLLPVQACEAVGGTHEAAIPAALAIACSHLSIILVDDMLDADPRGEYHQISGPAAANLASALQAAALASIAESRCGASHQLAALESLNRMTLATTIGQYLDVQRPSDETRYWQVVRAKSAPFFGAALHVGALLGEGSVRVAGQLRELGKLYGEMVQIHDDLNDSLSTPANVDWIEQRFPLPILFARLVEHPARERFITLSCHADDESALAEAQEILIACGAVSYCVEHLLRRHEAMQNLLGAIRLREPDGIHALAKAVIAPVWKLFDELDV